MLCLQCSIRGKKKRNHSWFKKKSWMLVDFWIQKRHANEKHKSLPSQTNHLHPWALSLATASLQPFFPQRCEWYTGDLKICHWNCRFLFCKHHVRFHVKQTSKAYLSSYSNPSFQYGQHEKTCKKKKQAKKKHWHDDRYRKSIFHVIFFDVSLYICYMYV